MNDWSTACPDWRERIVRRQSLIPPPIFAVEAKEALEQFKELRICDLPGKPTFGEVCDQWVFDFVSAIFGAYDADSGRRLIRDFFLLISKKNTKSTLAAGIMVTALARNWRHSAELLILAPTIEIANNSFIPARDMVLEHPDLRKLMKVQENFRTIKHLLTNAVLKVVAADKDVVSGKKAAFVLIDELWVFGKSAAADSMIREATGGLVSRAEGFVISLSTQSDKPPVGVFKAKLDYMRDVRDGLIVDKKSLPVIYEFPEEMIKAKAYTDPSNFYITNPNLGLSVDPEWLQDELVKAERGNADELRTFLSKHLNIEIGMNLRGDRWAGAEFWEDAVEPGLTFDRLLEVSDVVVVGIDGGGLDDLLGFSAIGRDKVNRSLWRVWCKAWAHPVVLQRRKEIAATLKDFASQGDLVFCERPTQDLEEVAEYCVRVRDAGLLPEHAGIGVDKAGLPALVDELVANDFKLADDDGTIIAVPQGGWLNPAIVGTERKVSDGTLVHAGQPLMNWAIGNAKVEVKGASYSITKQTSGSAKIDPFIAMLNAAMLMSRNPEAAVVFDAAGAIG